MAHEPAVPEPFQSLLAPLEELRYTGVGVRFRGCFGCGPDHDIGLRVRNFRSKGEVLSPIVIPRRFEGPPAGAHGGIVAGYLDEVLAGAALAHTGRPHVTGELSVRYLRLTTRAPDPGPGPAHQGVGEVRGRRRHTRRPRDGRSIRPRHGPLLPDATRAVGVLLPSSLTRKVQMRAAPRRSS